MRKLLLDAAAVVLAGTVAVSPALAHEHHGMAHDAQMEKLHAMMPVFATASARIQVAVKKKDAAAVDAEAGKIVAAIPDLKKSKPHKHASQRKKYVQLAEQLGRHASAVTAEAKKGDFSAAGKEYSRLSKTCDACHAIYRD